MCFSDVTSCVFPGAGAKTEVVDRGGGKYTVSYVPLTAGMYTLLLRYGGQPAAGFPTTVNVLPAVDTSKVKVFGPGVDDKGRETHVLLSLHRSSLLPSLLSPLLRPPATVFVWCVCV